ncbi:MAG TPA: hypothetical protein VLI39_07590 [Sedimentisphaerales bacterium]|nr:hypothetical protein [Sedimentisphaerales bacterium]
MPDSDPVVKPPDGAPAPTQTPASGSATGAGDKPADKPLDKPKDDYEGLKFEGEVDKELLGSFREVLLGGKIPLESAQKLADLGRKLSETALKQNADAWGKLRESWTNEIRADADFGGQKLPETIERAKRVLGKFGESGLVQFLDSTGFGDNPALIRLLAKVDRALGEDRTVDGAPSSGDNRSTAQVLYPKT